MVEPDEPVSNRDPAPSLDEVEQRILFPVKIVELFGPNGAPGERVVVRGWSQEKGFILWPMLLRIKFFFGKEFCGYEDVTPVVVSAFTRRELVFMLCQTLDWDQDEFDEKVKTFEELLMLVEAMVETSILRPGGGGAAPLLLRLAAHAEATFGEGYAEGLASLVSPKLGTSSSEPDTRSNQSPE